MTSPGHYTHTTPEQLSELLKFLGEHQDLARGKLRNLNGKARAKRLWEELCNKLNTMGGCTKSLPQWQKVWFDRKHLAKKAAADAHKLALQTGISPSLSKLELKVLSIMGDVVPASSKTKAPIPKTSRKVSKPSSFSQPVSLDFSGVVVKNDDSSEEESQPRQPVSHSSEEESQPRQPVSHSSEEEGQPRQPVSQPPRVSREPSTRRRLLQPTRPRRIASHTGSDAISRLIKLEEGRVEREVLRNKELAGIKTALMQLCGLMREYLDERD